MATFASSVRFQPANGVGPSAVGLADENGNYMLATGSQSESHQASTSYLFC